MRVKAHNDKREIIISKVCQVCKKLKAEGEFPDKDYICKSCKEAQRKGGHAV